MSMPCSGPRLGAIADDGIHEAPGIHYYFFNHAADPVPEYRRVG